VHDEPSWGVGSIVYIHGLLIAEDDLDSDENESTNLALFSTSTELTLTTAANPEPGPSHAGTSRGASLWCAKLCLKISETLSRSRGPPAYNP